MIKYRFKKILPELLIFVIVISVFFIIGEIVTRSIIGERLIVEVEEDGLFHFEPNQFGWYGHDTIYPATINEIGARGIIRDESLILFGDSFTFGWRLRDNETIGHYLGDVINYGMGGYGIDHFISSYNFNKESIDGKVIVLINEANFYVPMNPYKEDWRKEVFWEVRRHTAFMSYLWAVFIDWKAGFNEKEGNNIEGNVFTPENKEKLLEFYRLIEKDNEVLFYFTENEFTNYSKEAEKFCNENDLNCIYNLPDIRKKVIEKGYDIYAADGRHNSKFLNEEIAKDMLTRIE